MSKCHRNWKIRLQKNVKKKKPKWINVTLSPFSFSQILKITNLNKNIHEKQTEWIVWFIWNGPFSLNFIINKPKLWLTLELSFLHGIFQETIIDKMV
jgi:hypothetical protein